MTNRFAGRVSVVLVVAMLLSIIAPACVAAGDDPKGQIVISSFTDRTGSTNITAGRAEGIAVGAKGVVMRGEKKIADYVVEQVNWGYSKIAISNLAEGETVQVGDSAPLTGASEAPKAKKKGSSKWKGVAAAAAVGLLAYLLARNSGGGDDSTRAGDMISLKAEKTTTYGDDENTVIVTITATVKEADGDSAPDGTAVTFSTTSGKLNHTSTTTTGGQATATLTATASDDTATVSVTAYGKTATIVVSFGVSIDLTASNEKIQVSNGGGSPTESTITATCRDAKGNLATSGKVTFSSTKGTFSDDEVDIANGVATTTFSSTSSGKATITATWSNTSATADVTVTAGPPYAVTVSSSSSTVTCDGNSYATITATVVDSGGNSVTDGTVVDFSVTADGDGGGNGTIAAQAKTTSGKATASLFTRDSTGSKSKSGTATVKAEVLVASQPSDVPAPESDISDTATVNFVSRDVGAINIGASKTNIRGWDTVGNTTTLTAVVRDTDGNAVPDGTAVTFKASHGMISNATTTTNGSATATLTSDASGDGSWDGLVDITATAGGVSETAEGLVIFSGAPSQSHCSATISQSALAPSGGGATITVQAYDTNGNPVVDSTTVYATTSKGSISPSSGSTSGGTVLFTLSTSTDSDNPTESGAGVVTIRIPSGNTSADVTLTVDFTVN